MAKRTGATSIAKIPPEVLAQLNRGEAETVNLVEWLAVDQRQLLNAVLPQIGREALLPAAQSRLNGPEMTKTTRALPAICTAFLEALPEPDRRQELVQTLMQHPSDLVRGWGAYMIGLDTMLTLTEKLQRMRPLAADPHFGVREIAWLAVREDIIAALDEAIDRLQAWSLDPDENIRRFASEATRPCGVWTRHITVLKSEPERAQPVLDPLHSDPSRYVRDSVGNWLNDASKTRPDWVIERCRAWLQQADTDAARYIVRRAVRTLRKAGTAPDDLLV